MLKTILSPLLFILLALLIGGCGGDPPQPAPQSSTEASSAEAADGFPLTLDDGLGRRVTLDAAPQRIVSLAPKNTELLFALGAQDLLVGVTSYCSYPEAARELPQIGGFSSHSISMERVVGMRPDLVLSVGELQRPSIDALERLRIPVLALGAESLAAMEFEIELLGRVRGREQAAAQLLESLRRRVDAVRQQAAQIAEDQRVDVFYQIWNDPMAAAGPASFVGELIELAGGQNIVSDPSTPYVRISEEVVLRSDPQVIIAPSMGAARIRVEDFSQRSGWQSIRAVRQGRIYVLDGDLVSRCSPRAVDALEIIAHVFYPQRFELSQELAEFLTDDSRGEMP